MLQGKLRFPHLEGSLPDADLARSVIHAPHVVILGAGASRACCPNGDRNGRVLPVMNDLIAATGLAPLLKRAGVEYQGRNFEDLFGGLGSTRKGSALRTRIERALSRFFASLELPEAATVYDRLLLSLRPKDLVATFNWDPLLVQAFKRNRAVARLPELAFLHGCVDVGVCDDCPSRGFLDEPCRTCGRDREPTKLLYPVRTKGYAKNPFIVSEWARVREALRHAYFLTVFGYSAPKSDAEAVSLLREPWTAGRSFTLAQVEMINTTPADQVRASWADFIVRQHYGVGPDLRWAYSIGRNPRRSCEGLYSATMDLAPWPDHPMPLTESLRELQEWVAPLVREEELVLVGKGRLTHNGSAAA